LTLALLCSACATSTPAPTKSECVWDNVITIEQQDVLTDTTARKILKHNRGWEAVCRPRKTH
jgi:hypothetical protein